jgi:hypothetical protein
MVSTTHPAAAFPYRHHHPAATALLIALFWAVGAVLLVVIHATLEPWARHSSAAASIAVIVLIAFAYTRLTAREAGVTHALTVGITWLTLSIVSELVLTTAVGHPWFTLLGSPDWPLLRNVLLFGWIFAPALFARREAGA